MINTDKRCAGDVPATAEGTAATAARTFGACKLGFLAFNMAQSGDCAEREAFSMNLCPDHLQNIVTGNYSKSNIPDKEWFDGCHWKGKLCFNGIEKFRIYFSGKIIENYLVNNDDEAFIIKVLPVGTNEKITIFDERYHGYNALLIENLTGKEYSEETIFVDKDGKDIFEIILVVNYNVDFEDEYPNKETLELINGKIETIENIRRNAFDFLGIIIKNELGNVYNILEMELV